MPGDAAPTLDPDQLDQVKSAIQEATLDVYSGKDDHILRRLGLSLAIEPPAAPAVPRSASVDIDLSSR